MDGPDCEHYAPTPGLDLVKGVLSHAAAAGKSKDHVVTCALRGHFWPRRLLLFSHHNHWDSRQKLLRHAAGVRSGSPPVVVKQVQPAPVVEYVMPTPVVTYAHVSLVAYVARVITRTATSTVFPTSTAPITSVPITSLILVV